MASFNCRATPGSLRGASPRGASLRGAGREICSIWRVIESSRWWMSATSSRFLARQHRLRRGGVHAKFGGAESPMVELSQSLSDMPARRAAASALSRTDGSMPSTLHDTREFMLSSGSDSGATLRLQPPRASHTGDNRIPRRSSASGHRLFRVTVNNGLRNRPAGPESCPVGRNRRAARPAGVGACQWPERKSSVDFALAAVDRRDAARAGAGGQGIEGLFAPLRHGALVTNSEAQRQQLAGIRRRGGASGKRLLENAFVAGDSGRGDAPAAPSGRRATGRCRRCRARKAAPADRP